MLSSNHSSRSGLKRFIPTRATELCNQLVDTSAIALCTADEIMWRYLEASHNPYARLLHKGLTAGPKKLDHTNIDSTTAEAFNELQAGLAVVEDETLEGRLVASASQLIDSDEDVEVGRIGSILTSASVSVAIGVDEAVRALAATRIGGMLGLPKAAAFDTVACAAWNELHNELSSLPVDEPTSAGPSSSIAVHPKENKFIRLLAPTAAINSIAAISSAVAKRAVAAVPLSDPVLMAIVAAADRLPRAKAPQAPQLSSEAEAWDELQSNFSY
eukprot:GILI01002734.1.p1 GENE.GILI01002734.1~~GILI01002734.1.p1  ORF type:complete len:272 (+),score=73.96 GILI01002734.1:68-883(+)